MSGPFGMSSHTPSPVTIASPDTEKHRGHAMQLTTRVEALTIDDAESHGEALQLLIAMKLWMRGVRALLAESIDLSNKTHKSLTKLRSDLIAPVQSLYDMVQFDAIAWKKKALLEAERAAQMQAQAQAEADEQAAFDTAQELQDHGEEAAAEAVLDAQVDAPAPTVALTPAIAKVSGAIETGRWKAVLTNHRDAVAFVAAHPEFLNTIRWNSAAMNSLARAGGENFKFDGFVAEKDTTITVKT